MGHPPSHDSGFNTMARIPRNSPNKLLGGSLRLEGKLEDSRTSFTECYGMGRRLMEVNTLDWIHHVRRENPPS